jgi:hypothetical protein
MAGRGAIRELNVLGHLVQAYIARSDAATSSVRLKFIGWVRYRVEVLSTALEVVAAVYQRTSPVPA